MWVLSLLFYISTIFKNSRLRNKCILQSSYTINIRYLFPILFYKDKCSLGWMKNTIYPDEDIDS